MLDVGVHWEPETPFHTLKVNMGSPQPWRSGFDEAPDELVLNVDDEGVQSPPSVSGSRVCVWAVVEAPGPVSRGADLLGADRSCVSTCSTGTAVSSVPAFTAALLLVLAGRRRRGDP